MRKIIVFLMFIVFGLSLTACEENELAIQKSVAKIAIEAYLPLLDQNTLLVYDWDTLESIVEEAQDNIDSALDKAGVDSVFATAKTALDALILNEETNNTIKADFLEEYGYELVARYYGRYNDAFVFFIIDSNETEEPSSKIISIEGYEFSYNTLWTMLAWKDGVFYNLEETTVFDDEILTQTNVETIHNIHTNWN